MKNLFALLIAVFLFHVSKFDESLELLWVRHVRVSNALNVDHAWRTVIYHFPLEEGHSIRLDEQHLD